MKGGGGGDARYVAEAVQWRPMRAGVQCAVACNSNWAALQEPISGKAISLKGRSPITVNNCYKGASRYNVRIGRGRGSRKSRCNKVGSVNFIAYISSKCRQGGEGQKNPKILRTSYLEAP